MMRQRQQHELLAGGQQALLCDDVERPGECGGAHDSTSVAAGRAGVRLWQKMGEATAGKAPLQWLSTHPAGEARIRDIEGKLPGVMPQFEAAAKPERRFGPPPPARG